MRTDECKDPRLPPERLPLSNGDALTYFDLLLFLFALSPSILFCPPLSCVSNTFRLSHNNALTSNADGNAILLTCILSAPLLYPSLSLWVFGTVSLLSAMLISFPLLLPKTAQSILGLTETWICPEDSAFTPPPVRSGRWRYWSSHF